MIYLILKAWQRIPAAYGKTSEMEDEHTYTYTGERERMRESAERSCFRAMEPSFVKVSLLHLEGLAQIRVGAGALEESISPLHATQHHEEEALSLLCLAHSFQLCQSLPYLIGGQGRGLSRQWGSMKGSHRTGGGGEKRRRLTPRKTSFIKWKRENIKSFSDNSHNR